MKTKHIFVAALDVGGLLPFAVRKARTLQESLKEQERARVMLVKFIEKLEKNYREQIYYMGMDVIEAKSYERFIFGKGGFFEVMVEFPLAMNAHFVDEKKAGRFCMALKKTLAGMLRRDAVSRMFIDSIEVGSEVDQSLTYEKWNRLKGV